MATWVIKALVQKSISFLPEAHRINYLLQKHVTTNGTLTYPFFSDRMAHFKNHLKYFNEFHHRLPRETQVLELGTGWHPIIPLALFLAGFDHIVTLDVRRLWNKTSVKETMAMFLRIHEEQQLHQWIPYVSLNRVKRLVNAFYCIDHLEPLEVLEDLGIQTLLGDASDLHLLPDSRDLIISNNTLQDIDTTLLPLIFKEFKRIARPGCVMSHFVDLSDQFSLFDKSIGSYNFLKFSDETWSLFTNKLQAQNRMRVDYYRGLFKQSGARLLEEVNNPGNIQSLKRVKVHSKFDGIPLKDLAVLHTHLAGSFPPAPA